MGNKENAAHNKPNLVWCYRGESVFDTNIHLESLDLIISGILGRLTMRRIRIHQDYGSMLSKC